MAALRNKRFLVFGGAAALCLLFLGGSLVVHLRQYYSLHTQRVAAQAQLDELKKAIEGIDTDKLKQENDALANELSEIERSLPEREYVPTLLRQIESGAALTGNDLANISRGEMRTGLQAGPGAPGAEGATPPGDAAAKEGAAAGGAAAAGAAAGAAGEEPAIQGGQRYSEMDIEVRLRGSYASGFDFIKHLGKIGKIISVGSVEIERAGTRELRDSGEAEVETKLGCKAYILEPRSGFPGQVTIRVF